MTASTKFIAHVAATAVTDSVAVDVVVTEDVADTGVITVEDEVEVGRAEELVEDDVLRNPRSHCTTAFVT
jgi:hypothetical protein